MKDYLQKFCEIDSLRGLDKPVVWNGFVYATDGKIAIRVRAEDGEPNSVEKSCFNKIDGFNKIDEYLGKESEKEYMPLDIELPAPIKCNNCKGTGAISRCTKCEGIGVTECPTCGQDIKCEYCDGDGHGSAFDETCMCAKCNGTGEGFLPVAIGTEKFQRRYLALLQSLPAPVEIAIDPDHSKPALFRFPEGSGALMSY
jgi:hypothetical protein